MKLPHYERCEVPEAKITKYLLNLDSTNGKSKAQFFLAFGFTIDRWEIMANALKQHAADHDVSAVVLRPSFGRPSFGLNYVIEGVLLTPDGRNPLVRVIWTIDSGDDIPRLTSAYPLKEA